MIVITLNFIAKWSAHWSSTEEILGSNPFDYSILSSNSMNLLTTYCGKTLYCAFIHGELISDMSLLNLIHTEQKRQRIFFDDCRLFVDPFWVYFHLLAGKLIILHIISSKLIAIYFCLFFDSLRFRLV